MNWSTVEAGLVAWVRAATGLSDNGSVRWAEQNVAQNARPEIVLRTMRVRQLGHDWATVTTDEETFTETARGMREVTVSITCFGGTATGATSARAYLEKCRAYARLTTVRTALETAGIGLCPIDAVTTMDGVLGSSLFEPRAMMEVRFFTTSEVSETGNYIETVLLENLDTGEEFEVP